MRIKPEKKTLLKQIFWALFVVLTVGFVWLALSNGTNGWTLFLAVKDSFANGWTLLFIAAIGFGFFMKKFRPQQHQLHQEAGKQMLNWKMPTWAIVLVFAVFFGLPLLAVAYAAWLESL